ncbi:MAG: hypothetical protein HYR90_00460 [Candidatus Andersenbacteria bacterium]|nr:hypothetical protein [Candidatus Andersenbacteria bacterium]MBI3250705.1 hypothetical protein [Candidatus Andersenbacteria bacterium]
MNITPSISTIRIIPAVLALGVALAAVTIPSTAIAQVGYVGPAGIPVFFTPSANPANAFNYTQPAPTGYVGPSGIPVYSGFTPPTQTPTNPTQPSYYFSPAGIPVYFPRPAQPSLPCHCILLYGVPCQCPQQPIIHPRFIANPDNPLPPTEYPSYYYSPAGIPVYP